MVGSNGRKLRDLPEVRRIACKDQHGQAMVESLLSMMVLLLILFGLLQLGQIVLAKISVEFAAFRAARSSAVGFNNELAAREGRIRTIPASGDLVFPGEDSYDGSSSRTAWEQIVVERYLNGVQWLEYENWRGNPLYHTNYHCPKYGKKLDGKCGLCQSDTSPDGSLSIGISSLGNTVRTTATFHGYPLRIPFADGFMNMQDGVEISGSAALSNHSDAILE